MMNEVVRIKRKPHLRVIETYRGGPSPEFVARGRNLAMESPVRFEATTKSADDIII